MNDLVTTGNTPRPVPRKTGVLVHGYNLNAGQWERVVWGEPRERIGRVPMGVFAALYEQADVMVFGSGASRKDGLLESEATARLLWERFDELAGFEVFKCMSPAWRHPPSAGRIRRRIESILHLDTESRNTRDEIAHAGKVFADLEVERVILVSSPTHLPRCLRDACAIFGEYEDMSHLRQGIYAAPSVTGYPGYSAADVAIFEPPHRPDRMNPTDRTGVHVSRVIARVHDIPVAARERFVRRLDDLLLEFEV